MNTTTAAAPTLPPCIFVVNNSDGTKRETRSWDEAAQALAAAAAAKGSTVSLPAPGGGNTPPMPLDRAVAVTALARAMKHPSPVLLDRYSTAARTAPDPLATEALWPLAPTLASAADQIYRARRDGREVPRLEDAFGRNPHQIVDAIRATARLAHSALEEVAATAWVARIARMAAAEAAIGRPMHVVGAMCGTSPAEHVLKLWVWIALSLYTAALQKGGRHEYDPAAALSTLKAAHTALTGESTAPPLVNLATDAGDLAEWLGMALDSL